MSTMTLAIRGLKESLMWRASRMSSRFSPRKAKAKAQPSIECRGNPISEDHLFRYTNGRFLADEKSQVSKRYVRFSIDKLCDVIANIPGSKRSPVSKIERMEGGFNKALLFTTEDESQYIVKVPCPNAGRPMYCTASEVAVLRFIRDHTTIPVPKVIAWDSDASNAVGTEYIVMEKVPGIQIFKQWDEMGERNRMSLIKRLTQWECELSDIQFPAYGSLYYRSSLGKAETIPLDPSIDPKGEFCVGPSCGFSWLLQPGRSLSGINCGPWRTLFDMGESLVDRSLFKVTLANSSKLSENSQPVLWHTDLHMGNIFVSENDPGVVTGFIDWQNTLIGPAFLQARWPDFLSPPEGYQVGTVMPGLPPDFENMNDKDKEVALCDKAKATWSKLYEIACFLNNRKSWRAMQVAPELKEVFGRCGETWDEGVLPLREVLIAIFCNQRNLGFPPGGLPLHFTDEQVARHQREFAIYEEWHQMRKFVKKLLVTDDEGWISPDRDLDEMKSRNKLLFEYYVTKTQKSSDEVKNMWPFPVDQ